jgi:sec-independent protein translocase protein TatA
LFGLRGQELLIVLLIVLLVFGAKKLPDLARSLGASAKEFRKGIEEGSSEDTGSTVSDIQAPATETPPPVTDTQNPDS